MIMYAVHFLYMGTVSIVSLRDVIAFPSWSDRSGFSSVLVYATCCGRLNQLSLCSGRVLFLSITLYSPLR